MRGQLKKINSSPHSGRWSRSVELPRIIERVFKKPNEEGDRDVTRQSKSNGGIWGSFFCIVWEFSIHPANTFGVGILEQVGEAGRLKSVTKCSSGL